MSLQVKGVSMILLTYNGWELVQQSLPTLLNQDYETFEIIIVDNGSTDDSVQKIKKHYPNIALLELDHNQGFAGANNRGTEKAKYKHIMLVSNDIQLPTDCVRRLMAEMTTNEQCAVSGPKIHNLNMDMTHYPQNGTLSLTGIIIQNAFDQPEEVFGITGCAVLFDKEKLGVPFDEDYEFFYEDVYLSWRARLLGYSIKLVSGIEVIHIGEATVKAMGQRTIYLMERNRYLNFLTFFSLETKRKLEILMALQQMIKRMANVMKGRSNQPIDNALRWLREHKHIVLEKHKIMQLKRCVDDKEIIKWMSYKLTDHSSLAGKGINFLAYCWCLLRGLKTYEFRK